MQESLRSKSFIYHDLFNLTTEGHPHLAKLRSNSFLTWLSANGRVLIKVLLNFFLPIPLNKKRKINRSALGKKASSKASVLIFLLHNSSENAFLLFPLYPLIVSSSFCLPVAKLGVGIFGKNNAKKGKEDDCNVIITWPSYVISTLSLF